MVVKISSSFSESLCGLCGNYNENPTDDFKTPGGSLAPNAVEFGRSWKVEDGDRFCWDDCHGECKSCPPELAKKYEVEPFCGWISKVEGGPFQQCHSVVDPNIFLNNCVYDLCLNNGLKELLCEALKSYADACQKEGITISDWRSLSGCREYPCLMRRKINLGETCCRFDQSNNRTWIRSISLPYFNICKIEPRNIFIIWTLEQILDLKKTLRFIVKQVSSPQVWRD